MEDDERQSKIAQAELAGAELVAVAVTALCELVRVLSHGYKVPRHEIAQAVRRLIDGRTVIVDRPVVELGLAVLEAGGDFADGVIAYQGNWLGAETFVSFDKAAVERLAERGRAARQL
jgi:predicted nucleic-acid-binding protein